MKTIVNNAKMKINNTRMKIMKRKKMAMKFGKWKADGHAVAGWADLREPNAGLAAGRRSGSIRVPAGGGGGKGGQQGKVKTKSGEAGRRSGLQSPCLEGGWRRHSGGSMAPGSLDWLHQTLEGEHCWKFRASEKAKKKKLTVAPWASTSLSAQFPQCWAQAQARHKIRRAHPLGIWPAWETIQLTTPEGPQETGWAGSAYSEACTQQAHLHWASSQFVCMCLCPIARYEQDARITRSWGMCLDVVRDWADKLRKQTWGNLCRKKLSWKRTINIIFRGWLKKSLSFKKYILIYNMYLYTLFFREGIQIKQEYENVEDFPGGPVAKALMREPRFLQLRPGYFF